MTGALGAGAASIVAVEELESGSPSGVLEPLVRVLRDASADLVVARWGATVDAGWYDALRSSAYADSLIATASALPDAQALESQEDSVPIGGPIWGCVFVRRDALELAVASFGGSLAGRDVEAALEAALSQPGLAHRLVLTPVVVPAGGTEELKRRLAPHPRARRSLDLIEAGDRPLRVLLDGRCFSFPMSGTQLNVLWLVRSLAERGDLDVSVLLPDAVHPSLASEIPKLPRSVERRTDGRSGPRPDVFHHPYQLLFERELGDALGIADRLVITQQDLIATRTPGYFPSNELWERNAALTHLSLLTADHVAFFSEHARRDALDEVGLPLERTSVIPLGTEHLDEFRDRPDLDERPAGVADGTRYLLVLGNAYAHKNRLFALRLFERLVRDHGWDGTLVLAGGHPPFGASVDDERAYLARHPELRVVDLGEVGEGEKRWLLRNAEVLLYPSLYEGFGLVPFEAAALGTPAVYAHRSSMQEFLPLDGALLDGWDVTTIAAQVADLLRDEDRAQGLVHALRQTAVPLTWTRTADAYAALYRSVLSAPVGASLVVGNHFTIEPREAVAGGLDELRLLKAHRRSGALRGIGRALFAGFALARRLTRLRRTRAG